jgi:hypothetical protein
MISFGLDNYLSVALNHFVYTSDQQSSLLSFAIITYYQLKSEENEVKV